MQKYIQFCTIAKMPPTPTTESTLQLFCTHLAILNISHATIKVYLSAIHHMHVLAELYEHFSKQLTSWVQQVLWGIKKTQAQTSSPRIRLPITLPIMQDIKSLLSQQPHSYKNIMLWAACCLAFFRFLRVSEFTVPSVNQYDQSCHPSLEDISIDNRVNPRLVRVII